MLYPIENRVREVKDLSGIWNFKVDFEDKGFAEKWYENPLIDPMQMAVPASYNDLVTDEKIRDHVGYVWYETSFYIPKTWDNKRIVVRIGSATHHGTVWIDGVQVASHKGGFLPFEADITQLVMKQKDKQHRITIAVSNVLDWTCIPCGEIISKEGPGYPEGYRFQETYFDFFNYSGLHRPVKLYTTPKNYIKDIVIKTKKIDETLNEYHEVSYKVTFSGDSVADINIVNEGDSKDLFEAEVVSNIEDIRVSIVDEEGNVVATGVPELCATDNKSVCGKLAILDPHLWQPGNAYLYRLVVETNEDCYAEEFGLRTIEVTEKQFLINGEPFYFQGFGKHEDSDVHGKGLDEAMNIKDFNLLKWIGANSFRTSHYPYAEELLRLADREGFVVIDEVPAVGMCFWDGNQVFAGNRVNDETLKHHVDMLDEMYNRDKNHPSIVMWSVANEAATHEAGAVPYFEKVTSTMKSLDDTRPITIVHTTGADGDKVSQMVDVICVNRYYGWYTDHSHLEVIGLQLKDEMNRWFNKYHKPIILSEYGADTIAGYHKLPAVSFTEEFQCQYLTEFNNVFDQLDFMTGEHVWAFADFATKQGLNRVDGNKKGVFTRNRQPKMAAYVLRERWTNKKSK